MTTSDDAWVPQACTLPTRQRPLRVAEFNQLFATALRAQRRLSPTRLRWELDPAAEHATRDLIAREGSCCSFFAFTLTLHAGRLRLDVQVPAAHIDVLDALAAQPPAGIAE
jgi:hypothetical protein